MADLRSILAGLGGSNVVTLLNSGNVVFDAAGDTGPTAPAIEAALAAHHGFEVRVAVRSAAELDRAIAANPMPEALADPGHLLVGFLVTAMPPDRVAAFDADAVGPEVVRLGDGVVYLWYREGIGNSKLTIDVLEKRLGATLTARNWNTVTKLQALASR
jgi:uncharacterized protein (DUF1697 family)